MIRSARAICGLLVFLCGALASPVAAAQALDCSQKRPMTVRFYDVGQALSVLVTLPDGRHVLVDAGDRSNASTQHLAAGLTRDLQGQGIDVLWATHQDADHIGGAAKILGRFPVKVYVHNGTRSTKTTVKDILTAAKDRTAVVTIDPTHRDPPLPDNGSLRFRALVPPSWPRECSEQNDCSIGLRIDYCDSSVLFPGDAFKAEEALLEPWAEATLLQVSHHGSDTSSGDEFLRDVKPRYAVISVGKPREGTNTEYCHPSRETIEALTRNMHGPGARNIEAFQGKCPQPGTWSRIAADDHLWSTARDGDVVLVTTGDGRFQRVSSEPGVYVWSPQGKGRLFHDPGCPYARKIKNPARGTPPDDFTAHAACVPH